MPKIPSARTSELAGKMLLTGKQQSLFESIQERKWAIVKHELSQLPKFHQRGALLEILQNKDISKAIPLCDLPYQTRKNVIEQFKTHDLLDESQEERDRQYLSFKKGMDEGFYGFRIIIINPPQDEINENSRLIKSRRYRDESIKAEQDAYNKGYGIGYELYLEGRKGPQKGGLQDKKPWPIIFAIRNYLNNHPISLNKNNSDIAKGFMRNVRTSSSIKVKYDHIDWEVFCEQNEAHAQACEKRKKRTEYSIEYKTLEDRWIEVAKDPTKNPQ